MCGIIGILGNSSTAPRLIEGLKKLEYRGYDSAGISTIHDNAICTLKVKGKVSDLEQKLNECSLEGNMGIGHTRWATHGVPNHNNAHPHQTDKIAIVHNGIIENYRSLKQQLEGYGYKFGTETDTETILYLIEHNINQGMAPGEAVRRSLQQLEGAFALAVIFQNEDNLIIGAKNGPPLAIGYGDGEMYLGSDSYALSAFTNKIAYLEDGDMVILSKDAVQISNYQSNNAVERPARIITTSQTAVNKGNYKHFMHKEIHEQPTILADTLNSYLDLSNYTIKLPKLPFDLATIPKITIVACGTSYYAGMVAKYWFEAIARISVDVEIASEFRYREPNLPAGGLVILISQSGETADTLAALRYAKKHKQYTMSIINVAGSSMDRESDCSLEVHAGTEIGVASTKALTAQLMTLACFTLATAIARDTIEKQRLHSLITALMEVPGKVAAILSLEDDFRDIAKHLAKAHSVLYIGRGTGYPVALEGALKLKELSYIHAEALASGELKHGSIALIDESVPIVAIAPHDYLFEKNLSNIQEVAARGGKIIVVSDREGNKIMQDMTWKNIDVPSLTDSFVAPLVYVVPVQLLAYHTANHKGTDVDQPRNLAKSVTVE